MIMLVVLKGVGGSYWSLTCTSNHMYSCEHVSLLPCTVKGLADQTHLSQLSLHAASSVLAGKNCLTILRELFSKLSVYLSSLTAMQFA